MRSRYGDLKAVWVSKCCAFVAEHQLSAVDCFAFCFSPKCVASISKGCYFKAYYCWQDTIYSWPLPQVLGKSHMSADLILLFSDHVSLSARTNYWGNPNLCWLGPVFAGSVSTFSIVHISFGEIFIFHKLLKSVNLTLKAIMKTKHPWHVEDPVHICIYIYT